MSGIEHSGAIPAWRSLCRRLAAAAYDLMLVTALLMVLTALVIAARAGSPFDPRSIWFRALLLVGWWAYFAWSWTRGGRTVGMRAWRLKLVGRGGGPVSLWQATLRFACAWLSSLALGLGFLWSLVDRAGLTWHDRLSGTRLAREPASAQSQNRERGDEE